MPKTTKEIQDYDVTGHSGYDEYDLETLWFSEQELKDKLKDKENLRNSQTSKMLGRAEKRIDEEKITSSNNIRFLIHNKELDKIKQILNDCFGVGK